jgi:hypothetical protein
MNELRIDSPGDRSPDPFTSWLAQDTAAEQAEEVVEVPLLLPGWQISALEKEAHHRGLTAGEMVRHLLHDFITQHTRTNGRYKAGQL